MTGEYVPGLRVRLGGPPRKWLAMGLSQRCQGFVDLPGRLLRPGQLFMQLRGCVRRRQGLPFVLGAEP
jgi:hypothetical protein